MGALIAILFPIVVGTYWIYKNLSAVFKTIRSRGWPTVEGVITESYVGSEQREQGGKVYEPMLRCKFVVGESAYVSRKINWSPHKSQDREKIQAWINQYPEGRNVTVYYNPANPWEAVLKPVAPNALGRIVAGIVFIMIGIYIANSCASGSWCPGVTLEEALGILAD